MCCKGVCTSLQWYQFTMNTHEQQNFRSSFSNTGHILWSTVVVTVVVTVVKMSIEIENESVLYHKIHLKSI